MEAGPEEPGALAPPGGQLTLRGAARAARGLGGAVRFFEDFLGARYPYPAYSQVFLEGLGDRPALSVALSGVPAEALPEPRCPEGPLPCNLRQVEAFIHGWTKSSIHLKSWKESWIHHGVAGYLLNLYVERLVGPDAHRQRLWRAMNLLCALDRDTHSVPILPEEDWEILDFLDPKMIELVQVKSLLIFHQIEARVGRETMRKALRFIFRHASKPHAGGDDPEDGPGGGRSRAGTEGDEGGGGGSGAGRDRASSAGGGEGAAAATAAAGAAPPPPGSVVGGGGGGAEGAAAAAAAVGEDELGHGGARVMMPLTLTSRALLRLFRDFAGPAGRDLKDDFFRQWVAGGGVARLRVGACFNRRTNHFEVVLEQVVPPWGRPFVGQINIQVIEVDGKVDYLKRVDGKRHHWTFACRSRIRRRPKRKAPPGGAAGAAGGAEGGGAAAQDEAKARAAEEARRAQGSAIMRARDGNTSPVLWAVVDPEMLWLREVVMRQPDYMWAEQLFMDPDAAAQCAVLAALAEYPAAPPSRATVHPAHVLSDCVRGNVAHRMPAHRPAVRCEAALRLALWQRRRAPRRAALDVAGSWKGLNHLRTAFDEHFVEEGTGTLLPNWFDDPGEYLLKRALALGALAAGRTAEGVALPEAADFALRLLEENDDAENPRSGSAYLAFVLSCLPLLAFGDEAARGPVPGRLLARCLALARHDLARPSPHGRVAACAVLAAGEVELQRPGAPRGPYHALAADRAAPPLARLAALQAAMRLHIAEDVPGALGPPPPGPGQGGGEAGELGADERGKEGAGAPSRAAAADAGGGGGDDAPLPARDLSHSGTVTAVAWALGLIRREPALSPDPPAADKGDGDGDVDGRREVVAAGAKPPPPVLEPGWRRLALELAGDAALLRQPRAGALALAGRRPPLEDAQMGPTLLPFSDGGRCALLAGTPVRQGFLPAAAAAVEGGAGGGGGGGGGDPRAREVARDLWAMMTQESAFSQGERYQALRLWRATFGEDRAADPAPPPPPDPVGGGRASPGEGGGGGRRRRRAEEERAADWAGGLEGVLQILRERRAEMQSYKRFEGDWLIWAKEQKPQKIKFKVGSMNDFG